MRPQIPCLTTAVMSALDTSLREQLSQVSTATLTHQLQRRGIRNTFLSGLRPVKDGQRMVGVAHTLRYVPLREDLQPALSGGRNAQRLAIEGLAADEVLVIEARGEPDAGTIGDIFVSRRSPSAPQGSSPTGRCATPSAIRSPRPARLPPRRTRRCTVACTCPSTTRSSIARAGVTVMPDDRRRRRRGCGGGARGAGVEVAADAAEQELEEEWAFERLAGASTVGVFPIAADRRAEFEAWRPSGRHASTNGGRHDPPLDRDRGLPPRQPRSPPPAAPGCWWRRRRRREGPGQYLRSEDAESQIANLFHHVDAMLRTAGADWRHVVRMNFYVPDLAVRA